MRHLLKFIVSSLLLLFACNLLRAPQKMVPPLPPAAEETATPGPLPHVDWRAYHDPRTQLTIGYPITWQQADNGGYPVKITLQAAPGTTLLEKSLEIDVVPLAGECRQMMYGPSGGPTENVQVNGIDFVKESGVGPAAGNVYDWTTYSTARGSDCITLAFVLHSADPGVYATQPAAFDKAAESAIFDEILSTVKFNT